MPFQVDGGDPFNRRYRSNYSFILYYWAELILAASDYMATK